MALLITRTFFCLLLGLLFPLAWSEKFVYKNYDNILTDIKELQSKYPDLIEVTTAQEKFDLPSPGMCGEAKCVTPIVYLTNHKIDNTYKPQVYISGEVHGNERVGPTTTLEFIRLVLENYELNDFIKNLLDQRYLVISPMTNAQGYHDNHREETVESKVHIDPNRDFPFDLTDYSKCMQTVAARTVNELFISQLFQLAFTFHGGINVIGYVWGAPRHMIRHSQKSTEAPDFSAAQEISVLLHNVASKSRHTEEYILGTMTETVYEVRGGMEDWAYGAGWETSATQSCTPTTYNGYSSDKTNYSEHHPEALKTLMYLIETSTQKTPSSKDLGTKDLTCLLNLFRDPFNEDNASYCDIYHQDGHITRNIRMMLVLSDLAKATVWTSHSVDRAGGVVTLQWYVRGAFDVDETYVRYGVREKDDGDVADRFDDVVKDGSEKGWKLDMLEEVFPYQSVVSQGKGYWNRDGVTVFSWRSEILALLEDLDDRVVDFVVVARVDGHFGDQQKPDPALDPQSHFARSRLEPEYTAENAEFKVFNQYYVVGEPISMANKE